MNSVSSSVRRQVTVDNPSSSIRSASSHTTSRPVSAVTTNNKTSPLPNTVESPTGTSTTTNSGATSPKPRIPKSNTITGGNRTIGPSSMGRRSQYGTTTYENKTASTEKTNLTDSTSA